MSFFELVTHHGRKTVSQTDVGKGAYVPNAAQKDVMQIAGYVPVSHEEARLIDIIDVESGKALPSTYYDSMRQEEGRAPEGRIGRGLVGWLTQGDDLYLGTDGEHVYAYKANSDDEPPGASDESSVNNLSVKKLVERARKAGGSSKRTASSTVFERDPAVKRFAHLRSQFRCEMPGCDYVGFDKRNDEQYIEVHHIEALGEDGEDVIFNVAAVCPNCHKKAHYSKDANKIRELLLTTIKVKTEEFLETHQKD